MASTVDSVQTLRAMASILTAFTSCTGVSTATFAASMASQQSADTSLSVQEKAIITAMTTCLSSVTPSSSFMASIINAPGGGVIDGRTLYGAMTSILTAFSSAVGTSTANLNTAIQAQITADTGLTTQEVKMLTSFTSGIATATPSLTAHSMA